MTVTEVSKSRRLLNIALATTFGLCLIGTVVGIPLAMTFANGGKESTTTTLPVTSSETSTLATTTTKKATSTSKSSTTTTTTTAKTTSITTTTTTTSTTTPTTESTTTTPAGWEGWLEWTEWSDCSSTCGPGQVSRSRVCVSYSGNEAIVCDGYTGSDGLDVQECQLVVCTSGAEMVTSETAKAQEAGVEDNLFLGRYAQSVTLNGETVNAENSDSIGYGTWRMTDAQFTEILPMTNVVKRINSITNNLISNVNVSYSTNRFAC